MAVIILTIGVFLADSLRGAKGDDFVSWIYGFIPPMNMFACLSAGATRVDENISFGEMWKNKITGPLLMLNLFSIPLYLAIVALVEGLMVAIPRWRTRKDFNNHQFYFSQVRSRQPITDEAISAGMEAINARPGEFAIRVKQVSRLFFDNSKKPIAAVNNVSLGIKRGSLFGFLGANGAGKTTLLKMITGELSISSGLIEVNGSPASSASRKISICPQFNDHLTNEATVVEHLKYFGWIFGLKDEESKELSERFISELELEEEKNKTVKELSGGNARKLALAISLMSPADIVLLDEPTSSLDPVVRHKVHDLINTFRGTKTFMLCTHLLGEAEELCDEISIMIRGSVFVVGTPQFLSAKFGTEWRVDLLLSDDGTDNVAAFFGQNFPNATLVINRPKNRIYSIPASDVEIVDLFRSIRRAIEENVGIKFFTCSASTLEKVFLELVIKAEEMEAAAVNNVPFGGI
jgi:ABC-type multidrug transport system ATPase subunit